MGRLIPATPYDAEAMMQFRNGTTFEIFAQTEERQRRKLRLYWKVLNTVVKSTGRWPRSRNLHNDIKLTLGYVTMSFDLMTRDVIRTPDSTAVNEMSPEEFDEYFTRAMDLLATKIGVDPMVLIEESSR